MTKNISWSTIDRWKYNYSDPYKHKPPHYSLYTGLSLGQTFAAFLILITFHLIAITLVKVKSLRRNEIDNWFNFTVHLLENINIPFPYKDWDTENLTVAGFKEKLRELNIEMAMTFVVNLVFSLLMFCPFWWTGTLNL